MFNKIQSAHLTYRAWLCCLFPGWEHSSVGTVCIVLSGRLRPRVSVVKMGSFSVTIWFPKASCQVRICKPMLEDKGSLAVGTVCTIPLDFLLAMMRGLPARKELMDNITHHSSSSSFLQPPKECHPKSQALPFAPGPDQSRLHNNSQTTGDLCCCTRISRGQELSSLLPAVSHLEGNRPVGLTMRKVSGEQEELCSWLCSIIWKLGLLSSWWAGTVVEAGPIWLEREAKDFVD